jgi:hypothetical protein
MEAAPDRKEIVMRLLILAASLALPASSMPAQAPVPKAALTPKPLPALAPQSALAPQAKTGANALDCEFNTNLRHAIGEGTPKANKLGELPTGNLHLAVMREVEGCQEPVIVRQGFGAMAPPERR